eukprot:4566863-Pleurochrysis_carterae.AAC.3
MVHAADNACQAAPGRTEPMDQRVPSLIITTSLTVQHMHLAVRVARMASQAGVRGLAAARLPLLEALCCQHVAARIGNCSRDGVSSETLSLSSIIIIDESGAGVNNNMREREVDDFEQETDCEEMFNSANQVVTNYSSLGRDVCA